MTQIRHLLCNVMSLPHMTATKYKELQQLHEMHCTAIEIKIKGLVMPYGGIDMGQRSNDYSIKC